MEGQSQNMSLVSQQAIIDEKESIYQSIEGNKPFWIELLEEYMLEPLKNPPRGGPQLDICQTTYGKTAYYAKHFLMEANCNELKLICKLILDGLVNLNYDGRRNITSSKRPSVMWEVFAAHYLTLFVLEEVNVVRFGGAGDKGVDVAILENGNAGVVKAIVQCKRGRFFQKGKGPAIIRELRGAMDLFPLGRGISLREDMYKNDRPLYSGIIFSNELEEAIYSQECKDHLMEYQKRGINIRIIGYRTIEKALSELDQPDEIANLRTFLLRFVDGEILNNIVRVYEKSRQFPKSQPVPGNISGPGFFFQ